MPLIATLIFLWKPNSNPRLGVAASQYNPLVFTAHCWASAFVAYINKESNETRLIINLFFIIVICLFLIIRHAPAVWTPALYYCLPFYKEWWTLCWNVPFLRIKGYILKYWNNVLIDNELHFWGKPKCFWKTFIQKLLLKAGFKGTHLQQVNHHVCWNKFRNKPFAALHTGLKRIENGLKKLK